MKIHVPFGVPSYVILTSTFQYSHQCDDPCKLNIGFGWLKQKDHSLSDQCNVFQVTGGMG